MPGLKLIWQIDEKSVISELYEYVTKIESFSQFFSSEQKK